VRGFVGVCRWFCGPGLGGGGGAGGVGDGRCGVGGSGSDAGKPAGDL
jgi:hypothetical protein